MGQAFLKQNVKIVGELPYELVGEIDVTSASTQVDFTGLNFTSDDDLLLVSDVYNPLSGNISCAVYPNDNVTDTNYYKQQLSASSTTVSAQRQNTGECVGVTGLKRSLCYSKLKLAESGHFTSQNNTSRTYGESGIELLTRYVTATFTLTNITKLSIKSNVTNRIGIGSNFKLYKLVAEKVADITVSTATTQVDITGLNIDKDSEYMLVSDVIGVSNILLYTNNNVVNSNYYSQQLFANSTSVSSVRYNAPYILSLESPFSGLCVSNIKLTNSGHFVSQNDSVFKVGSSTVALMSRYSASTFSTPSVTELNIICDAVNGIGIGSRFTLYRIRG